jgi:hypothetical protein
VAAALHPAHIPRALSLAGPATYETSIERVGANRCRIEVWSFEFRMRKGRDGDEPMLELDSDQRFAESVALSSTQPADRPLPRRALRLSLDLVALRARRIEEPK